MTPQELYTKELKLYSTHGSAYDKFYYSLPYAKDTELCDWMSARKFSGNVIKYYQYKLDKPVIIISEEEE